MNYYPLATSPDRAFPPNRSRRQNLASSSSFSTGVPPEYSRSNSCASSDSGYVDNEPYDPFSIESHFPAARSGRQSKVLQRDQIMNKFPEVTSLVEQAFNGISYENLDITAEDKEQVVLVLSQFIKAKGRADAPHDELFKGLVNAAENFEKMLMMLKTIKDFMLKANPNLTSFLPLTDRMSNSGVSGVSTISSCGGGDNGGGAVFKLSDSSVLKILKGDITKWSVDGSSDAIVNSANERMLGGGRKESVVRAIHRAAGPQLGIACNKVPEVRRGVRCPTGEARITPGFNLVASHVIHTVGPVYYSVHNPEAPLRNAYRNCLRVAKENNIQYIAFPAISCGAYRYPFDEAAIVALSTVKEFTKDFKEVHFVLFADDIYTVWLNKAKEILQA